MTAAKQTKLDHRYCLTHLHEADQAQLMREGTRGQITRLHTFGPWEVVGGVTGKPWEPGDGLIMAAPSKVRVCTFCGYQEKQGC